MKKNEKQQERLLELMLVMTTAAVACVLYHTVSMKIVVLNLFYLPVVLAGFFLGRYRSGVLALLSVVIATIVISTDLSGFGAVTSPLAVGLSVTLWGAVLGLTALLVGTLCDERDAKAVEAHEAHVGVVEVLSKYLQSANPDLQDRARRVAQLAERVARKMRLSPKEQDDIRVASLLIDMENIEITARVIKKAVGEMEDREPATVQRTFHGAELVQSLGSVLTGAFPLLLNQSDSRTGMADQTPFGAKIIRTVRAYVHLERDNWSNVAPTSADLLDELRADLDYEHHPAVLHALEQVISGGDSGEFVLPLTRPARPEAAAV